MACEDCGTRGSEPRGAGDVAVIEAGDGGEDGVVQVAEGA